MPETTDTFQATTEQVKRLPTLNKTLHMAEGEKIADNPEVLKFCTTKVPAGKHAVVRLRMVVVALEDVAESDV